MKLPLKLEINKVKKEGLDFIIKAREKGLKRISFVDLTFNLMNEEDLKDINNKNFLVKI